MLNKLYLSQGLILQPQFIRMITDTIFSQILTYPLGVSKLFSKG